jgi:hypothetical protein
VRVTDIGREASEEYLAWCADAGVPSIAAVQPVHVATWMTADLGVIATGL